MRSSIASALQRFRPGIAPTLVVLVLLPLMVGLGFWQLARGHEKATAGRPLCRAPRSRAGQQCAAQ